MGNVHIFFTKTANSQNIINFMIKKNRILKKGFVYF